MRLNGSQKEGTVALVRQGVLWARVLRLHPHHFTHALIALTTAK